MINKWCDLPEDYIISPKSEAFALAQAGEQELKIEKFPLLRIRNITKIQNFKPKVLWHNWLMSIGVYNKYI